MSPQANVSISKYQKSKLLGSNVDASIAAAFSHPSAKKDSEGGQQISEDRESNRESPASKKAGGAQEAGRGHRHDS